VVFLYVGPTAVCQRVADCWNVVSLFGAMPIFSASLFRAAFFLGSSASVPSRTLTCRRFVPAGVTTPCRKLPYQRSLYAFAFQKHITLLVSSGLHGSPFRFQQVPGNDFTPHIFGKQSGIEANGTTHGNRWKLRLMAADPRLRHAEEFGCLCDSEHDPNRKEIWINS
jgi:hypothetical protein